MSFFYLLFIRTDVPLAKVRAQEDCIHKILESNHMRIIWIVILVRPVGSYCNNHERWMAETKQDYK
jgi:hypothetical protein